MIVAREDRPIDTDDLGVVKRVASRFHNLLGVSAWERSGELKQRAAELQQSGEEGEANKLLDRGKRQQETAAEAWQEAFRLDEQLAAAAHNLAILSEAAGEIDDAKQQRAVAWALDSQLKAHPHHVAGGPAMIPLIGVWTRYTEHIGGKLVSQDKKAELIVLRLSHEFMATENILLLEHVEEILEETRSSMDQLPEGLTISLSGSAAVGGDMLRSAKDSIKNTELYTIILVVSILLVVYRSPLLVAVPLVSIVVSLIVATGLVAALTQAHLLPGWEWWNFKVFTTTKIFVVVILFGAGTDYCLFLIARYKEELDAGRDKATAIRQALVGVGDALVASALTTIVGLATMFFAQFGKFAQQRASHWALLVGDVTCLSDVGAGTSARARQFGVLVHRFPDIVFVQQWRRKENELAKQTLGASGWPDCCTSGAGLGSLYVGDAPLCHHGGRRPDHVRSTQRTRRQSH